MFDGLKRALAQRRAEGRWAPLAGWAASAGHAFKRARDGSGFVVESGVTVLGWRLEWGPSQRPYIAGHELRLRADLKGGGDLQMLVVSRALMERLEREVYEQFTEGLQTRMDGSTPEEMRWLVLFPKPPAYPSRALREAFGVVSNEAEAAEQWIAGPLGARLVEARAAWLERETPLVITAQRGRLTLRTAMAEPDLVRTRAAVELFEAALRDGRRVAERWRRTPHATTHPAFSSVVPQPSRVDSVPPTAAGDELPRA